MDFGSYSIYNLLILTPLTAWSFLNNSSQINIPRLDFLLNLKTLYATTQYPSQFRCLVDRPMIQVCSTEFITLPHTNLLSNLLSFLCPSLSKMVSNYLKLFIYLFIYLFVCMPTCVCVLC
jgi:hypothetical protein